MPMMYSPQFRESAVALVVDKGRRVADVARDLESPSHAVAVEHQARGEAPGTSMDESAQLRDALNRIKQLEEELRATRGWPRRFSTTHARLKRRSPAVSTLTGQGISIRTTSRVLGVSERGYRHHRNRSPSQRRLRHEMLAETIRAIHLASRGRYGVHRMHAELTIGMGIEVGSGQVRSIMKHLGSRSRRNGWTMKRPSKQPNVGLVCRSREFFCGRPVSSSATSVLPQSTIGVFRCCRAATVRRDRRRRRECRWPWERDRCSAVSASWSQVAVRWGVAGSSVTAAMRLSRTTSAVRSAPRCPRTR